MGWMGWMDGMDGIREWRWRGWEEDDGMEVASRKLCLLFVLTWERQLTWGSQWLWAVAHISQESES